MQRRVFITLVGAAVGFAVDGPWTALMGAAIAFASGGRPRLPATAAVALIVATAFVTLTERTIDVGSFSRFADTRPLANWAARFVTVTWFVAVAAGWVTRSVPDERRRDAGVERDVEVDESRPDELRPGHLVSPGDADILSDGCRTGGSSLVLRDAAIGVVVAIGAAMVSLVLVGDREWAWLALPLAVGGLVVATGLFLAGRMGRRWSALIQAVPGRGAAAISARKDDVVNGSIWMLAGTAAVSIGSFVLWVTAARVASQEAVGGAAALFSVVTFLNYATSLGLPIALTRFARTDQRSSVLFTWSLLLTAASSIVGVALFALVAPTTVRDALTGSWLGWASLTLNAVGMSVSVLVDVRCMTLRLWSWVFWRSVAIAVIRLPLLFVVGGMAMGDGDATLLLFTVVIGGYSVTGLATLLLLVVRRRERLTCRPRPDDQGQLVRFAAVNYLGQLAIQGPFFAVPLIALTVLDAETNASFYLAWGIMSVVVMSIQIIGQVLLVEGDRATDGRDPARTALGAAIGVASISVVAVAVLRPVVRAVYGAGYEEVPDLLLVLVAGTIPYAVTVVALNRARIRSDHRATLVISLGFSALVLTPALILVNGNGAAGAAWAWAVGNAAAAALALVWGVSGSARAGTRQHVPVLEAEGAERSPVTTSTADVS